MPGIASNRVGPIGHTRAATHMAGRWLAAALLALAALGVAPARAADEAPPLAGRLTAVVGDVLIWRHEEGGEGYWDTAQINDVIGPETGLHTGADGRAEVRVGPAAFRLGPQSRGGFAHLSWDLLVFNLEFGALNVRLRALEPGERVAATVEGARIDLAAPGSYAIDSGPAGLRVSTFDGQASVQSALGASTVGRGSAWSTDAQFRGTSIARAAGDDLDAWAQSRELAYRAVPQAPPQVSRWMTGYEDLEGNGRWANDPEYGSVWFPTAVPTDWVPYREGQWRWVPPWGWTWVDVAPWGFAPFHYGRWVLVGSRWAWWPGAFVARPVFAPALVGFVSNPGWGASVSVGGPAFVGWFPLAPWQPFQPSFRIAPTNVVVINRIVVAQPVRPLPAGPPRGITVVPGGRFAHGPVGPAVVPPQRWGQPGLEHADWRPAPPPRGLPRDPQRGRPGFAGVPAASPRGPLPVAAPPTQAGASAPVDRNDRNSMNRIERGPVDRSEPAWPRPGEPEFRRGGGGDVPQVRRPQPISPMAPNSPVQAASPGAQPPGMGAAPGLPTVSGTPGLPGVTGRTGDPRSDQRGYGRPDRGGPGGGPGVAPGAPHGAVPGVPQGAPPSAPPPVHPAVPPAQRSDAPPRPDAAPRGEPDGRKQVPPGERRSGERANEPRGPNRGQMER